MTVKRVHLRTTTPPVLRSASGALRPQQRQRRARVEPAVIKGAADDGAGETGAIGLQ